MIVCHCHGVTDREIRAIVHNGARTCADVADACSAGAGCGGCESLVAEIVQSERRHLAIVRSEVRSDVTASPMARLPAHGEAALAG